MEIYEKQFELAMSNSDYWHSKSGDLLSSARILYKAMEQNSNLEISCYSTYKMLMGMSFEALIKAHCIALKITDNKVNSSHKLNDLANLANLQITKNEHRIFSVLSEYVIWHGKYPAPKKSIQLKDFREKIQATEYNKVKLGNLDCYTTNGCMSFSNLLIIWRKLSDSYMNNYNKT